MVKILTALEARILYDAFSKAYDDFLELEIDERELTYLKEAMVILYKLQEKPIEEVILDE